MLARSRAGKFLNIPYFNYLGSGLGVGLNILIFYV